MVVVMKAVFGSIHIEFHYFHSCHSNSHSCQECLCNEGSVHSLYTLSLPSTVSILTLCSLFFQASMYVLSLSISLFFCSFLYHFLNPTTLLSHIVLLLFFTISPWFIAFSSSHYFRYVTLNY